MDNGSRDRTADGGPGGGRHGRERAAAGLRPRLPRRHRRGRGRPDVLVFLDGDHSDYPAQLVDVVAPILEGRADLVIGSRCRGRREAGAHPWHAVLGTPRLRGPHEPAHGRRRPPTSGPSARSRAEALRRLDMRDRDYGWTVEMQVKAARQGLRVVEVPVDYRPRIGRSKVSGTVRGTIGAGTKIVATILRHAGGRVIPRDFGSTGPEESAVSRAGAGGPLVACPDGAPRGDSGLARGGAVSCSRPACSRGRSGLLPDADRPATSRSSGWRSPRTSRRSPPRGASRGAACSPASAWPSLWRALLVAAPPLLSNDINRYVWEGRVQVHGGNPYRWSDRPESAALAAAARRGLRRAQPQGLHGGLPAALRPRHARRSSPSTTPFTAMKAFLVACELATLGVARPPAAAPAPAARAPPRARLEPARARRDRRQRAQRRLRHAVDGARAPRPRRRPAAPLGSGRGARASCRSTCPASWPPRGRGGTGGGTCSPPSPSRARSSSPTSTRRRRRRCS